MKYIIDIPKEVKWIQGIKSTGFGTQAQGLVPVEALTPYTEPDRSVIEAEVWDLVEDEVWELARLIVLKADDGGLKHSEFNSCFGGDSIQEVMKNYSYQEAKAKYEAWKAEKESKIEVGDGVYGKINQKNGVVVRIYADDIYSDCVGVMWEDGGLGPFCTIEGLQKTGRHFSQLSDLLKAMKGEK